MLFIIMFIIISVDVICVWVCEHVWCVYQWCVCLVPCGAPRARGGRARSTSRRWRRRARSGRASHACALLLYGTLVQLRSGKVRVNILKYHCYLRYLQYLLFKLATLCIDLIKRKDRQYRQIQRTATPSTKNISNQIKNTLLHRDNI